MEFYRRLIGAYGELGLVVQVSLIVALLVLTTAFAIAVVVSLPPDYFTRGPRPDLWWKRHPIVRWTVIGLKNLLGILVLIPGFLMALPFVPGPGLVFILLGLSLLDFPGKRRLELAILGRRRVLGFLNDVRSRLGKTPLECPRGSGA